MSISSRWRRSFWSPVGALVALLAAGVLGSLPGCLGWSNRAYTTGAPDYRGLTRVAVLLRHWPAYRQLPGQPRLDSDFITADTPFFAALGPKKEPDPRAVAVADLEELVADTLLAALRDRGYEPILLSAEALAPSEVPLAEFLARQRPLTPEMDAYLVGFYGPTLYVSRPEQAPAAAHLRPYTLEEVTRHLTPGRSRLLWAGPAASQAPPLSISHAVIHFALTLFRAADGKPVWQVAGSRVAGHPKGIVANCPPFPSRENYWTGKEVIQRLMLENLACRLHFLLPDAIPGPATHRGGLKASFFVAECGFFPHNGDRRRTVSFSLLGIAPWS